MHRSIATIALSLCLSLLACKSDDRARTETRTEPVAPASAVTTTSMAAPQPSTPSLMDIPQKFAYEASHRPPRAVRAEQVFDAFASHGTALGARKQHLAGPFGALYCLGSSAEKERQFFSVCEYAGDAEAERGIESAKAFGTERRDVIRNGNSILIARWEAHAPSDAERIFRELKPAP